ncbi:response regulator transcription factor [Bosea sp. (in: a-proteobacteria)]|uniref:response regulator n=1 Tax=Bosea sp. (in: a-proteobacteria) TaxID=1871050 RepID=UPI0027353769|nr:response regulator transcription factor [Bosea sp. (in: a-proteobacteria)]MDP3254398.1 response regulator transcription factor [Bosea sp. (in: a-proteobacteria)]
MSTRTIAIVDDHPLLAEGLAAVLGRYAHLSVIATGSKADDILEIIDEHAPDIVLLDLNMPGDAFAVLNEVRVRVVPTKLIVFTASTSTDHAINALAAGASGFVLKGSQAGELVEAIDAVTRGEVFITPSFAAKVIGALQTKEAEKRAAERLKLSVREEQIVRLLLVGKQNREIAKALDLSEKTIKSYMSNLMAKLNARNRLEVVIAAQKFMPTDQERRRGPQMP